VIAPGIVVTQLESPLAVVEAAARWCETQRARLVLNPSPVRPVPDWLVRLADPLIANEEEARLLAEAGRVRLSRRWPASLPSVAGP
jgi:ribokinase